MRRGMWIGMGIALMLSMSACGAPEQRESASVTAQQTTQEAIQSDPTDEIQPSETAEAAQGESDESDASAIVDLNQLHQMTGLTWGMSRKEVIDKMGEPLRDAFDREYYLINEWDILPDLPVMDQHLRLYYEGEEAQPEAMRMQGMTFAFAFDADTNASEKMMRYVQVLCQNEPISQGPESDKYEYIMYQTDAFDVNAIFFHEQQEGRDEGTIEIYPLGYWQNEAE